MSQDSLDKATDSAAKAMTPTEEFLDILKTVGIAVGVTLFIRFFFFQPFNIPSGSMQPTLQIGDFVIVDKIEYGYSRASFIYPFTRAPMEGRLFDSAPERGDVIVFKNSHDRNRDYIKRLVGMPGDTVQMLNGVLHINGARVQRVLITDREPQCADAGENAAQARLFQETLPNGVTYVVQECRGDNGPSDRTQKFVVPEDHYFMVGDNRDNSADSRTPVVRFVPKDQLVGRARRIAFSVDGQNAAIWQIWKWPTAIRYNRLLDPVE